MIRSQGSPANFAMLVSNATLPFDNGEMTYLVFSRGQPRYAVGPGVQAVPAHRQMLQAGLIKPLDSELLDQFFQRAAVAARRG